MQKPTELRDLFLCIGRQETQHGTAAERPFDTYLVSRGSLNNLYVVTLQPLNNMYLMLCGKAALESRTFAS
jgi:hypothetical protein